MNKIKCLTANTQETEKVSDIQLELRTLVTQRVVSWWPSFTSHVVDGLLWPSSVPPNTFYSPFYTVNFFSSNFLYLLKNVLTYGINCCANSDWKGIKKPKKPRRIEKKTRIKTIRSATNHKLKKLNTCKQILRWKKRWNYPEVLNRLRITKPSSLNGC